MKCMKYLLFIYVVHIQLKVSSLLIKYRGWLGNINNLSLLKVSWMVIMAIYIDNVTQLFKVRLITLFTRMSSVLGFSCGGGWCLWCRYGGVVWCGVVWWCQCLCSCVCPYVRSPPTSELAELAPVSRLSTCWPGAGEPPTNSHVSSSQPATPPDTPPAPSEWCSLQSCWVIDLLLRERERERDQLSRSRQGKY